MSKSEHEKKSQANLTQILSPWVGKPAGLLENAWASSKALVQIGAESTVSDIERYIGVRDFILLTSYIASAKLTEEVKNVIVDTEHGWAAGLLTKDEIRKFVQVGSKMSQEMFDLYMKEERAVMGQQMNKTILYCSLLFGGVDGLNAEEIVRFLKVGKHMGIKEKELNDLLITYFHEKSLLNAFQQFNSKL